jgi:hypothetical protein
MSRKTGGPNLITWLIAVALGVLGILMRMRLVELPWLGVDPFWFVAAGFVLLAAAKFLKGL